MVSLIQAAALSLKRVSAKEDKAVVHQSKQIKEVGVDIEQKKDLWLWVNLTSYLPPPSRPLLLHFYCKFEQRCSSKFVDG